ncbi:MAG: hypothetical protein BWZ03_00218 [bacterium ADurb.BinA186]|nr:MAG: hypothetical protein BWZ03_00218 [bacterium ADurb.BinA186]
MLALTPAFTVTTQPTFNGSREINFVWPTEISDELCAKIANATIKLGSAIGTKIVKIISCEHKSIKLQINSPKEKKIVSTPPLAIFNSDSKKFYKELFFVQSYLTTLLKKLDIDPSNGYFMGYYNVSFWATFTTCFGCTEDPLCPPYSLYFMPLP